MLWAKSPSLAPLLRERMAFVELLARSSFSFLRGASQREEMVSRAKEIGLEAIGLCDRDGLYGSALALGGLGLFFC